MSSSRTCGCRGRRCPCDRGGGRRSTPDYRDRRDRATRRSRTPSTPSSAAPPTSSPSRSSSTSCCTSLDSALEQRRLKTKTPICGQQLDERFGFGAWSGAPRMRALYPASSTRSLRRPAPCSSPGRRAPARSMVARPSTTAVRVGHSGSWPQLQRHPRAAAGGRALRPRAGGLHRRGGHPVGQDRAGQQGHAIPGRDRDDEPGLADEAAPRVAGAGIRARGRFRPSEGGRARHCGDQLGSGAHGVGRQVPGRSLLPVERDSDPPASPARIERKTSRRWCFTSCSGSAATFLRRYGPERRLVQGRAGGWAHRRRPG